MSPAAYFATVKRRAKPEGFANPMREAQIHIDKYGETGEGKALLAVVRALWTGEGEFTESDLFSLGERSLSLAAALIEAREMGLYADWEWHRTSSYPAWRFLLDLHKKLEQ